MRPTIELRKLPTVSLLQLESQERRAAYLPMRWIRPVMALPMAAKQLFFCQPRLRTAWPRVPRDDAHVSLICNMKSA
jgi:hypothetical protein